MKNYPNLCIASCLFAVAVFLIGHATSAEKTNPPFAHPDSTQAIEWKASWIGVKEPAAANQWIAFRKTFELSDVPASAIARIAADSKYWLWLNGKLVVREGGLKRGPTPQDTYFDEINLNTNLQRGTNTLAVLLWHYGKEGFSHKNSGTAGLLFQMENTADHVISDSSWKAMIHPAFERTGEPDPNYRLPESNIRFDANKDIPGWEAAGFDDSAWPLAREYGKAPCAPWNQLIKRTVPFWKDYGLKPYTNSTEFPQISDGKNLIARLPYNAQVTPYLKIDADAGVLIKIQADNYMGGGETNVRAEYLTRQGIQEFEFPGWMNGHALHYEIPKGVKVINLGYRESGFDTKFSGTFTCDNDFLNQLRTKAIRTLYITMRDTYMDCPDRERALWWGDAVNELGEAFYALDRRADTLTRKSIMELVAWQKPNGILYSPVPSGNWNKDLPLQMLASIGRQGFWTYGLYSGDKETLRAVYPRVKRYMEIWDMQPNGLVKEIPGAWPWGDWGDNVDMTVLYNAWYHLGLQGMENMAATLEITNDLTWVKQRKTLIEGAFNKHFWNGKEYRTPAFKGHTDDRANALAVVSGLAKPDQYPALLEVFKKQEHASPYMEKYVLEALCMMDEAALAQDRMQRRYTKMVDHPEYTTLWEGWGIGKEGFGGGTTNHAWSGGPLTIMSQYFAGIEPTSLGFKTYQVKPRMGNLKRIEANVETVRGPISVNMRKQDQIFELDLSSPADCVARVGIPMHQEMREIKVNGETAWKSGKSVALPGIKFLGASNGFLDFETQSGQWKFAASY
ncbi:MAG: glycoside hydrolase [Gloeobacteraceae cyanobacterium ES-bin-144]|nr:glycoside hydrolase [Verrucomicrobiales bacterium]